MHSILIRKINALSFDAYTLKMIAIVAMVIDHIAVLFFPNLIIFRIIGRLTLPIMAFFIAEGYTKTSNAKRYMIRLGLFAIISMIPYYLVYLCPFSMDQSY